MSVSHAKSNSYFVYGIIIVVAILLKVGICICACHIYKLFKVSRKPDQADNNIDNTSEDISLMERNARVSVSNSSQTPSGHLNYPSLSTPQSQTILPSGLSVQSQLSQDQSYLVSPPTYGETIC